VARDRASIRLDIWADSEWRDLDDVEQFLYFQLLAHPTLSYAGVADWRPGRIAMFSKNGSAAEVRRRAEGLQAHNFVLIDDESEEILVRSFVKHDGLLKQPKLAVSMANAYAAIASRKIREVVAYEVQKQHKRYPELSCWTAKQVQTILEAKASGIESFTRPVTPAVTPALTPSGGQALGVPTTTSTTTSTPKGVGGASRRKPEIPLPDDWAPNPTHVAYAVEFGVDLGHEVSQFKAHAAANDRRQRDWDSAFRQWLGNAKKWAKAGEKPTPIAPRKNDARECEVHMGYPLPCIRCEERPY
jgi:hypothetical protein